MVKIYLYEKYHRPTIKRQSKKGIGACTAFSTSFEITEGVIEMRKEK